MKMSPSAYFFSVSLSCAAFFNTSSALAEAPNMGGIDSGGGKSSVGAYTNHSSIGHPFATGTVSVGDTALNPGLIEVLYATPFISDKDGNGLPDAWEETHFAGKRPVDPQADPDGDGSSNLMEYLAGTNPNDNTSKFTSQGTHNGSQHTIPIQTIANRTYQVFVSNNLVDWYLDETYIGDGAQKVFNFDETTIAPEDPLYSPTHPSKYFFRIKITDTP